MQGILNVEDEKSKYGRWLVKYRRNLRNQGILDSVAARYIEFTGVIDQHEMFLNEDLKDIATSYDYVIDQHEMFLNVSIIRTLYPLFCYRST